MTWHPTAALTRSLIVAAVAAGLAVLFGSPGLAVLALPFAVLAALAIRCRPTTEPRAATRLDHHVLHEGQATCSRLTVTGQGIEHVTRMAEPSAYVSLGPRSGVLSGLAGSGRTDEMVVGVHRWGRVELGDEHIAVTSCWGGFRAGPTPVRGSWVTVLPSPAPYDAVAEVPHPVGLVGIHRSRRTGDGTEYAGTRPFQAGDRLRRVNWRVSLRTRSLQADTTLTEEDTGVLLLVDALADHGRSGGVEGAASSLDLTVRAAAAVAEQHIRQGDRVALRVVGGRSEQVGSGSGIRHLRRLLGVLALLRPGELADEPTTLRLRPGAGTVVVILSPVVADLIGTTAAALARSGLPVLVIDTLPDEVRPALDAGPGRAADLAWRMRLLERDAVVARLAETGTPVVPWRGPRTLDDVMRRLARQSRSPRLAAR